jgi:N-methylhydantoinase B
METGTEEQIVESSDFFMTADEVESEYGIDIITAETLRNGLIEVTRYMHSNLQRSSFSNVIRDGMDFGVCVHVVNDDESTDLVAITEGCTQFAFTHAHMTNMVLDEWGLANLAPGDTLVTNDAFRGGIHFGDLNLFRVVHDEDGAPAFVLSDAAHAFDMGGPIPGGFNNSAASLYEEGLRLPPMLLTAGDEAVGPTFNLLFENTRSPLHMMGDVRALLGTLRAGESRLNAIVERYGVAAVRAASNYALGLAERRMRLALSRVEDGEYTHEVELDDDGITPEPVKVKMTVRIKGAAAEIDFSGTDRQSIGPVSTCWQDGARAIIGPKVVLDPRHPMNAGAMRPFDVLLPKGSAVLKLPPGSQSQHADMGAKIASGMVQLFSTAYPENAVASDSATTGVILAYGLDDRPGLEGSPFGCAMIFGGGWGGTQSKDGISYCMSPLYNCRSVIVEFAERETPMVIWEYGVVPDTAGAGEHRGGYAPFWTVEALTTAIMSPLMDGARKSEDGLKGGTGGSPTYGVLINREPGQSVIGRGGILPSDRFQPLVGIFDAERRPDPVNGQFGLGTEFETVKLTGYPLEAGKVLRMQVAGAAGYGDPLDRDPAAVQRDVFNELVTVGHARDVYGVVFAAAGLEVDDEATASRRAELRQGRERGEWVPTASYFHDWPTTEAEMEQLLPGNTPPTLVAKGG